MARSMAVIASGRGEAPPDDGREAECADTYRPRTALGRQLWAIRQEVLASGEPLLDWDGIAAEVAERRGGLGDTLGDTDVG